MSVKSCENLWKNRTSHRMGIWAANMRVGGEDVVKKFNTYSYNRALSQHACMHVCMRAAVFALLRVTNGVSVKIGFSSVKKKQLRSFKI